MVTIILLLTNVIVYILTSTGRISTDEMGSSYYEVFVRKEYWRIITGAFAHLDITHILFNMFSQLTIGSFVEDVYGSLKMLLIYFGSLILGRIMSMLIRHANHDDYTLSCGASGAICGLMGAYFTFVIYRYGLDGLSYLIRPIVNVAIMSFLPGIDGTSHVCCLAVGLLISWLLLKV
ncbi:MAG: rhomboid family intramembrane serine protease [Erysipelotrichaceae bacterium]|nr:rhomboid family intramembrane serine protease [Erysipelotrichaceae bacterium]